MLVALVIQVFFMGIDAFQIRVMHSCLNWWVSPSEHLAEPSVLDDCIPDLDKAELKELWTRQSFFPTLDLRMLPHLSGLQFYHLW